MQQTVRDRDTNGTGTAQIEDLKAHFAEKIRILIRNEIRGNI